MEVLILQVFVSLMLVAGSVLLFMKSVRSRDYEHADRLALFPIAEDDAKPAPESPALETPPKNA
ncbi:MAG: hypothetical protein U0235_01955 [Polyangiaceae bacterium]